MRNDETIRQKDTWDDPYMGPQSPSITRTPGRLTKGSRVKTNPNTPKGIKKGRKK